MEVKIIRASLTREKAVAIIAEMVGIIGKVIGTGAYIEENCTDPEVAKTGKLMKEALSMFMTKTLEFLQEDADQEEGYRDQDIGKVNHGRSPFLYGNQPFSRRKRMWFPCLPCFQP